MSWIIFALLTAVFKSFKDVFNKKALQDADEFVVAWSVSFFSIPFILAYLHFFEGFPDLSAGFPWILVMGGVIASAGLVFYLKALKAGELSVTVPLLAFVPLLLLITSPLIVGEFPSLTGLIGVLLIVLGSYHLHVKHFDVHFLAPFKALFEEPGVKFMLVVVVLWSLGANVDKLGVLNSSPAFWVFSINSIMSLFLLPFVLFKSKNPVTQVKSNFKAFALLGFINAVQLTFQMIAISLALVAYVISVKRLSLLLSVVWGHVLFKEEHFRERFVGTLIMVLGVALIALS